MLEETGALTIYTIDELCTMAAPLVKRYNMRSARLFGSYVCGEASADSDIDLIVDKGDQRSYGPVFGLAEDLCEASSKRPDVYDISVLRPGPLRDAFLSEAMVL